MEHSKAHYAIFAPHFLGLNYLLTSTCCSAPNSCNPKPRRSSYSGWRTQPRMHQVRTNRTLLNSRDECGGKLSNNIHVPHTIHSLPNFHACSVCIAQWRELLSARRSMEQSLPVLKKRGRKPKPRGPVAPPSDSGGSRAFGGESQTMTEQVGFRAAD